jgi:hypothetical protein
LCLLCFLGLHPELDQLSVLVNFGETLLTVGQHHQGASPTAQVSLQTPSETDELHAVLRESQQQAISKMAQAWAEWELWYTHA